MTNKVKSLCLAIFATALMAVAGFLFSINSARDSVRAEEGHQNHCVCGAIHKTVGNHTEEENIVWQPLQQWSDLKTTGYYYLTKNIEIGGTLFIENGNHVTVCLNGFSISKNTTAILDYSFDKMLIEVKYNSSFTVTDCKTNCGKIYGGQGDSNLYKTGTKEDYLKDTMSSYKADVVATAGGINIKSGTFNLYNGSICENVLDGKRSHFIERNPNVKFASYSVMGAGVYLTGTSAFNMYGGDISNNRAMALDMEVNTEEGETTYFESYSQGLGSAIYAVDNSTISIYGGEIKDNIAGGCAGDGITKPSTFGSVISAPKSTVNIAGGKIYNNKLNDYNNGDYYQYATVYANDVNVTGGEIIDDTTNFVIASKGNAVISGGKLLNVNDNYYSGAILSSKDEKTNEGEYSTVSFAGSPEIKGVDTDVALMNYSDKSIYSYAYASYDGVAYAGEPIRIDFAYDSIDIGPVVYDILNDEDKNKFVPANSGKLTFNYVASGTNYLTASVSNNDLTWLDENGNVLSNGYPASLSCGETLGASLPTYVPSDPNLKFAGWYYKNNEDSFYKTSLALADTKIYGKTTFKVATYYDFELTEDENGNQYYPISSASDLHNLALIFNGMVDREKYEGKEFRLTTNVDLSSICGESVGNWMPIGSQNKFIASFDGQGYTISNLYLNDKDLNNAGLFGSTSGTIKNVNVSDCYVVGGENTGALVGNASDILNCTVSGTSGNSIVSGKINVGGLCGAIAGNIANSKNLGVPVTGLSNVGGIVGTHQRNLAAVLNCENNAPVSGNYQVGGICGETKQIVENCKNTGTISGGQMVGGICGSAQKSPNDTAHVISCINDAPVVGDTMVGGICGASGSTIDGCTSMGLVEEAGVETTVVSGFAKTTVSNSNAFDNNSFTLTYVTIDGNLLAEQDISAIDLTSGGLLNPPSFNLEEDEIIIGYYVLPDDYGGTDFYLSDAEKWDLENDRISGDTTIYVLIEEKNLMLEAGGNVEYYGKLKTAFYYANNYSYQGYAPTITIVRDYTEESIISLWGGDYIHTLDLNGKTVSFPSEPLHTVDEYGNNFSTINDVGFLLISSGQIEFTDSSAEKSGRINAIILVDGGWLHISDGNYVSVVALLSRLTFSGGTFSGLTQEQYYTAIQPENNSLNSTFGMVLFGLGTNGIGLTVSPVNQDYVDNAPDDETKQFYTEVMSMNFPRSIEESAIERKAFDKQKGIVNYIDSNYNPIELPTLDISSLVSTPEFTVPDGTFFIETMPSGTSVVDASIVSFEMLGIGEQVPYQEVVNGTNATEPESQTVDVYSIVGWWKLVDGNSLVDFSFDTPIYEDVTLVAKWSIDPSLAVARVGDVYCSDLETALQLSVTTGKEIVVLSGNDLPFSSTTTIPEGLNVTINLENNSSLTFNGEDGQPAIAVDGSLTVKGEGDVVLQTGGIAVGANGTLNIEGANFVYDENNEFITTEDGADVSISGGSFSSNVDEEFWADDYVIVSGSQSFEAIHLDEYAVYFKEQLRIIMEDTMANGYYNQISINYFTTILNEAHEKIDLTSTKNEVDTLFTYYSNKFSYVLTTFEYETAISNAMIEIRQYALSCTVPLSHELVSAQIEILNKKATLADISAQTLVVLDAIDTVVLERELALQTAKDNAIATLLGENDVNIKNVTTAMLSSIYSAKDLNEVSTALKVALEEQQEIIKYKNVISTTGNTATNNSTKLEELKDSLTAIGGILGSLDTVEFGSIIQGIDNAITAINTVASTANSINNKVATSSELNDLSSSLSSSVSSAINSVKDFINDNVVKVIGTEEGILGNIKESITTLSNSIALNNTTITNSLSSIDQKVNDIVAQFDQDGDITKLQSSLNELSTSLAPNGALYNGLINGVQSLTNGISSKIDTLNNTVSALNQTITTDHAEFDTAIADINSALSSLATQDDIDGINNALNDLTTSLAPNGDLYNGLINGVQSLTNGISSKIDTLNNTVSALNQTITTDHAEFDTAITDINSALSSLATQDDIDGINNALNDLTTSLAPNGDLYNGLINGVQSLTNNISSKIDTLNNTVSALNQTITTDHAEFDSAIADINSAIENVSSQENISGIIDSLNNLTTSLAPNGTIYNNLIAGVERLTVNVSEKIEALDEVVDTLSTMIDTNHSAIDTALNSINSALSSLATQDDIDGINNALNELSTSLAPNGTIYNNLIAGVERLLSNFDTKLNEIKELASTASQNAINASNSAQGAYNVANQAKALSEQAITLSNQAIVLITQANGKLDEISDALEDLTSITNTTNESANEAKELAVQAQEKAQQAIEKSQTAEIKSYASNAIRDVQTWLDEYIESSLSDYGALPIVYAIEQDTYNASEDTYRTQLEQKLTDNYSQNYKQQVLNYYDQLMIQLGFATAEVEIDYLTSSFISDVSLLEKTSNAPTTVVQSETSELLQFISIGVELLILIVIIVGVFILLKKSKTKNGSTDKELEEKPETKTISKITQDEELITIKNQDVIEEIPVSNEPVAKEPVIEKPDAKEPIAEEIIAPKNVDIEREDANDIEEGLENAIENEESAKSYGDGKSKSFSERLNSADDETKANYTAVRDELLSYKHVKVRTSKPCESFRFGRKLLCKFVLRGKTLRVYLALDPKKFELTKFNHVDVSDKNPLKDTPMLMKVRSRRSLKRTVRLIGKLALENGLVKLS